MVTKLFQFIGGYSTVLKVYSIPVLLSAEGLSQCVSAGKSRHLGVLSTEMFSFIDSKRGSCREAQSISGSSFSIRGDRPFKGLAVSHAQVPDCR